MSAMVQSRFQLKELMDGLQNLEAQVDDRLTAYRWRPYAKPQTPAIYNWMPGAGEHDFADNVLHRDVVNIYVRIGVDYSAEAEDDMADVEEYASKFIDIIDPALYRQYPMGVQTCKKARRVTVRTIADTFDEMSVFAIEFPIEFEMYRVVPPNQ